jgi:hypothetical protein
MKRREAARRHAAAASTARATAVRVAKAARTAVAAHRRIVGVEHGDARQVDHLEIRVEQHATHCRRRLFHDAAIALPRTARDHHRLAEHLVGPVALRAARSTAGAAARTAAGADTADRLPG